MDTKQPEQLTGKASIYAGTHIDGELQMTPAQKAMAGPQPEKKTVAMEALRDGYFNGESYQTGDTVDVPETHVEALTLSGFAARSDRAEVAQQARDAKAKDAADATAAAEKKAADRSARRSTAVKPLTTRDVPGAEPAANTGGEPPHQA